MRLFDSWLIHKINILILSHLFSIYLHAMGYLGRPRRNQNVEQCHYTFSDLVIRRKLYEAIIFVFEWEPWGVLLPEELTTDKVAITEETVDAVLAKNFRTKKPKFWRCRCMTKSLFLFPWILQKMWSNWLNVNFQGYLVLATQTPRL